MCATETHSVHVEFDFADGDVTAWRAFATDHDREIVMWYEGSPGPFEQHTILEELRDSVTRCLGAAMASGSKLLRMP